jgi:integrase
VPTIAKDKNGNQLKHDVLGGRAQVIMFTDRSYSWHYRQHIKGKRTGRNVKGSSYINRCLDELDLEKAIKKAEDLYFLLSKNVDEDGEPIQRFKVVDLIKEWILLNEERNRAGSMSLSTLRAKVSSLQSAAILFITDYKKITYIDQIKRDTFESYSRWRKNEAAKIIKNSRGKLIIPKDSTVKRDIVHIAEWFKYLNDKGYIDLKPTFEVIKQRKDDFDANPPIPLDPDWGHIHRYMKQWSEIPLKEETKTANWRRTHYWRMCFRTLVLVLYNTGARPSELVGKEEKIREAQKDGSYIIKRIIKGGLRWEDIEIEDSLNLNSATGKEIPVLISNIYIRYSKTGEPRDVPCTCATFFARWRKTCNEYRQATGLRKLTKKDYVFFNPHTDKPYPYSQFSKAWDDLRTNLSLVLSPVRSDNKYTLYSLRSSYITNQIDEGKDIYLIKKITGHSLEMLQRHYDRSDVRKRKAEATQRTIGKKKRAKVSVDLESVDEWGDDAVSGKISAASIALKVNPLKKH